MRTNKQQQCDQRLSYLLRFQLQILFGNFKAGVAEYAFTEQVNCAMFFSSLIKDSRLGKKTKKHWHTLKIHTEQYYIIVVFLSCYFHKRTDIV